MSTKSEIIDGCEVYFTKLPPLRAIQLKAKIGRFLAPAFANGAGGALRQLEGIESLANADANAITNIVGSLLSALDPATLPDLIVELLRTTSIVVEDEGGRRVKRDLLSPAEIDRVFLDKELLLYKVLGFALREHFADFLRGVSSLRG